MIKFTIDGTEYQAEEGMTWEDWVNSEYNISELDVIDGLVYNIGGMNIQKDNINVLSTDILINNMSYTIDDGYFPS